MRLHDGGGRTLDELAARTGHPADVLRLVLAEEVARRRVTLDPLAGEYRLVADRFEPGTLAAMAGLGERRNGHAGPEQASRFGRCSGCGADWDTRTRGCRACSDRFRNRRRRRSPLPTVT
jgi:hypothetical protein